MHVMPDDAGAVGTEVGALLQTGHCPDVFFSTDKLLVPRGAARVPRPGGRFATSGVIADHDIDGRTRADMAAWTSCIARALTEQDFRSAPSVDPSGAF